MSHQDQVNQRVKQSALNDLTERITLLTANSNNVTNDLINAFNHLINQLADLPVTGLTEDELMAALQPLAQQFINLLHDAQISFNLGSNILIYHWFNPHNFA